MEESLKRQTVTGMVWSSVQRFGTMAVSFLSNLVLARLLSPDDFGCIGMLMIFIALANTFVDGGFGAALIQKREPTRADYSTILYTNIIVAVFLYAVLYASAPAIAQFYRIPLLGSVLRVQGLILIVNALGIVQNNQLRKRLQFRKIAVISIVASSLSVIVAIAAAWYGYGVWSLVVQQLVLSGLTTLLLWASGGWTPMRSFSRRSFRELFGFGSFILLSNLMNTLCSNIQGLIIGRFFAPATMGLYTQARKLEEVASTSFSAIVDQVSYPVLAEIQNDREAMIGALKRFILALGYVCFPMMILLIVVAHPLIVLLYSEKWVLCIPYFRILCVAGIAICLQGINYYGVAAIGKSDSLFVWTLVKRSLGLIFLFAGLCWGMIGLMWGMVAASYTIYIVNACLVSRHIGYRLSAQFRDLLPVVVLSAATGAVVYRAGMFIDFGNFTDCVVLSAIYVSIYVGISALSGMRAFKIFCHAVRELRMRRNRSCI